MTRRRPFDGLPEYLDPAVQTVVGAAPTRARRILNSRAVAVLVDGLVWVLNLRSIARKAGR